MRVERVKLNNYRNIVSGDLLLSPTLTILYGDNGQGKTNILESIYLLGSIRPFRSAKIPHLIRHGESESIVRGLFRQGNIQNTLILGLKDKHRRVLLNGKVVHNPVELHGRLLVTVFSPDEIGIVRMGPEQRRRYLDRSLYMRDRTFLDVYHQYYRTLKQRNALLKSGNFKGIDIWDQQLAHAGCSLMAHRRRYIEELSDKASCGYMHIADGKEQTSLEYLPALTLPACNQEIAFLEELQAHRDQDCRQKVTTRGPHKDDILFLIDGRPLKGFGSQGQHRSFMLALKVAEIELLEETFGELPVLLLDDITSELDAKRLNNLLTLLHDKRVQVVVTTTDVRHFTQAPQHGVVRYKVEAGKLHYEDMTGYE